MSDTRLLPRQVPHGSSSTTCTCSPSRPCKPCATPIRARSPSAVPLHSSSCQRRSRSARRPSAAVPSSYRRVPLRDFRAPVPSAEFLSSADNQHDFRATAARDPTLVGDPLLTCASSRVRAMTCPSPTHPHPGCGAGTELSHNPLHRTCSKSFLTPHFSRSPRIEDTLNIAIVRIDENLN